jgi:hypothetical protein
MQKRIYDIVEYKHVITGKIIIRKGMRKLPINVYKLHGENEPWRYQGSGKEVKLN